MHVKGILFTTVSALLFGVSPILASITYDMGSSPITLTFYRNLFAIPVLLMILLGKKIDLKVSGKMMGTLAVLGILGCGITTLMLYTSYQYIGVGMATTLHFLYPVFVALLCHFFYKEKLEIHKVLALLVAGLGILCFMEHKQITNSIGILLAAASGFTYAIYMVGIEKKGLRDINAYKLSFYIAIVVSISLLLYNSTANKIVFLLTPMTFFYTFIISLSTSILAVVFLQLGIKYLGATNAAIFCLFEPISSIIAGRLFLGEPFTPLKIMGSLLIIISVSVLLLKMKRSAKYLLVDKSHKTQI